MLSRVVPRNIPLVTCIFLVYARVYIEKIQVTRGTFYVIECVPVRDVIET